MKSYKTFKQYHFIGIGGIGMSALALILVQKGIAVSGSDVNDSRLLDTLRSAGIQVWIGHDGAHVPTTGAVVYSTDVKEDNPEIRAARENHLPLLHRSEVLATLLQHQKGLLVTGTHGKTTTSALLAHVLIAAGADPTIAIGGMVSNLKSNGCFGNGIYFVAEADESDGSFLKYGGYGAIITNIDSDHLNYWQTEERLIDGFRKFQKGIESSDHLLWCADDKNLNGLHFPGRSYGFSEHADLKIENYLQEGWRMQFDLKIQDHLYEGVEIPLIGAHNVLNASAVFGLCLRLGLSEGVIRTHFRSFAGVGRRTDKKGEVAGITIYDDYAHHPTEVFSTLRALKLATTGKRLVVAFQPHRYTRTKDCLETFPEAFGSADEVVLTDIYAAGEPAISGITAESLYRKIKDSFPAVHYVQRPYLVEFLKTFLKPNDVLVTMGAGDVTKVGPELVTAFKNR